MSVSIKLARFGKKHSSFYRIVAAPTKSKRDGKNLEIIGGFNPTTKKLDLDKKLFDAWVNKGAIVTTGVKKVLEKQK